MTPEVARRYYLDAMGITAWASRYQLPNALPTEACEWDDTPSEKTPPRDRLQAVLDDAPLPRKEAKPSEVSAPSPEASPSSVRALLGQAPPAAEPPVKEAVSPAPKPAPAASAKPLRFALSCVCIGQRWLSLHPGDITPKEQQLLSNILQAASIQQGEMPSIMLFEWPPMANAFEVGEPLEEAREGLSAFIAGSAGRKGWKLKRVLWWGEHETQHAANDILQVLNVQQAHSQTLALPIWQGPSLAELIQNPQAKRELWPALNTLGQEWQTLEKDSNSRD